MRQVAAKLDALAAGYDEEMAAIRAQVGTCCASACACACVQGSCTRKFVSKASARLFVPQVPASKHACHLCCPAHELAVLLLNFEGRLLSQLFAGSRVVASGVTMGKRSLVAVVWRLAAQLRLHSAGHGAGKMGMCCVRLLCAV